MTKIDFSFDPCMHSVMAPTRNLIRDEELGTISDEDDSPSGKRSKLDRFPLSRWELAVSLGVFLVFSSGLFCIYITMPSAEFGKLKLPRSISDLRLLKDNLANYANEYPEPANNARTKLLEKGITPTLPNLFINLASPIVDVPFHVFFLATLVGLIPAAYITVRAGLAIGDLKSVKDLYDFKTLSVLFLIGFISILPTILKRKKIYE
ncbi:unnamed protein product [Brassica napus]|uniref:Uncharacterized protein n=2 Tax=Brassica TaxID=3705 RepID=A0A3P6AFN8_BRACM|nr:unnamed protein product [Brassica napus]VDC88405.1 unnamed protein product [Brassica rapa]